MVVEYLITIKALTIKKKLRRNRQKFEIFFVKFQVPFSQKIINIHLYVSYKASYVQSRLDSGDRQMIHTLIISLLIEKPSYLFRPQSFSFQIVSEVIDTFVKFSDSMSRGWGFLHPVLSRGEGFCTQ